MRNEVIHRVETDPERASGGGPVVKESQPTRTHCREIMFEPECLTINQWFFGASGAQRETGWAVQPDLPEEASGNMSPGSAIVGADDDRRGAVSHHHEIH